MPWCLSLLHPLRELQGLQELLLCELMDTDLGEREFWAHGSGRFTSDRTAGGVPGNAQKYTEMHRNVQKCTEMYRKG